MTEAEYIQAEMELAAMNEAQELQAEIDRLQAENVRLHDRLEDNREYHFKDGEMTLVSVEPGSIPDGIECRDQTIKLQDAEIDRLRAAIAELKALLPWTDFADDNAAHELARLRKENAELRAENADLRIMLQNVAAGDWSEFDVIEAYLAKTAKE